MKQADGLGPNGEKLWVHVSCSLWIPEVGLPWLLVELELYFLRSCCTDWLVRFSCVVLRCEVAAVLLIDRKSNESCYSK